MVGRLSTWAAITGSRPSIHGMVPPLGSWTCCGHDSGSKGRL
uniref:Uncharacterized protein n=1 Tax=Arundo donax TaxID=35708 RepID=A0A0A8Z5Q6_ARUDO